MLFHRYNSNSNSIVHNDRTPGECWLWDDGLTGGRADGEQGSENGNSKVQEGKISKSKSCLFYFIARGISDNKSNS